MKSVMQKMVSGWAFIMVLIALMIAAVPAFAGTIVGIIDWDANPPTTPWVANPVSVSVAPTNDGNQWLRIDFEADDPLDVLVFGSAADLFVGTWRSEFWIEFDFWAETTLPDTLQVRWGAGGDSTNIWGNAVTPSGGIGTWQTLRTASLGNVADWNIGLVNPDDFLTDLSAIDWIGVYIERGGSGNESYGIDDVSLMVPEPAEIMLLAAAFGVGLLVFRRMRLVPVAG